MIKLTKVAVALMCSLVLANEAGSPFDPCNTQDYNSYN